MHKKQLLLILSVLVLVTLACGIDIDVPITTDVKTGPMVTDEIYVPNLGNSEEIAEITFEFGAGEMYLSSGAEGALISGTAEYNVEDFRPEIETSGEFITIKTGNLELDGFPNFDERVKNIWNLKLGNQPIKLRIKSGAYVGELELGNLYLRDLRVSDGAADVNLNFGQPNRTEMQTLHYETGASDVKLTTLGNANFNSLIFESGAGNYELDFSGEWKRDATAFIETGLSNMTITVPDNVNVTVIVDEGFTNITDRGNWSQSGNEYTNNGDGPRFTINVQIGAGNLILRTD
jgi:hypothetical protein